MSRKRSSGRSISVLGLLLATALASACSNQAGGAEGAEVAQTVEIVAASLESIADQYALAGTLQAKEEAFIAFEADGRVTKTYVETGDVIEAGDTLASLDALNYELQLERAEAALGQAEAGVNQAKASVASATAGLSSAQESRDVLSPNTLSLAQEAYRKAIYDFNKIELMYEEGEVSESDYNGARLMLKQAETDYLNAQAQINQSSTGVASAEATLAQARAGLEQAEAAYREASAAWEQAKMALDKSALTSPMAGVVLEKFVTTGQLIGRGQSAYRIGDISQLKVVLPVPDQEIRHWSVGQEVQLTLYGESRTGTVHNVYPIATAGSSAVNVEVLLPNPNSDWLPGQVVKAARTSTGKEGILLPIEAVVSAGGEPYVFKHVDGRAVKTSVALGDLINNRLHVVSGVAPGDEIVMKGASKLFDGDLITTSKENAE